MTYGTPMERRQQAADASWAAFEAREERVRFEELLPLDARTDATAEQPKSEPKEKLP